MIRHIFGLDSSESVDDCGLWGERCWLVPAPWRTTTSTCGFAPRRNALARSMFLADDVEEFLSSEVPGP
jgi:hypothetical protein